MRQLVLAMINLEGIKDADNSTATRTFQPAAHNSLLLEATCREIFLAFINRCNKDWKIRLLVNHSLSYDKEMDLQKGSNDQRRKRLETEG